MKYYHKISKSQNKKDLENSKSFFLFTIFTKSNTPLHYSTHSEHHLTPQDCQAYFQIL